jgi:hypothetical protein
MIREIMIKNLSWSADNIYPGSILLAKDLTFMWNYLWRKQFVLMLGV